MPLNTPIETELTSSKSADPSMKLFTAIAMILVVVGHINSSGFDGPFNMFPPYSFHVAAFIFVSGYFYNDKAENCVAKYLVRKTKRLMIPLYLITLLYGSISFFLFLLGFLWGQQPTPSLFILEPLTNGHQFTINMAMWFIVPLFFAECANILIRKTIRSRTAEAPPSTKPERLFFLCSTCH